MDQIDFDSVLPAAQAGADWAWERIYTDLAGQVRGSVHGGIYDIHDGLVCDLNMNVTRDDNFQEVYQQALNSLTR